MDAMLLENARFSTVVKEGRKTSVHVRRYTNRFVYACVHTYIADLKSQIVQEVKSAQISYCTAEPAGLSPDLQRSPP